jgi:hypothetical protein
MEISKLVTKENNVVINQVLVIAKQDIAIENAINTLNNLSHINRIEFEDYGHSYGISKELLDEVRNLQDKLQKVKYGRYC